MDSGIGLFRGMDRGHGGRSRYPVAAILLLLCFGLLSSLPPAYGQAPAAIEAIRKGRNKPAPLPTPKPTMKAKPRTASRPVVKPKAKPRAKPRPRRTAVVKSRAVSRPAVNKVAARNGLTLPRGVRTRINPRDGAPMVWIPAGEFVRGSDDRDKEAGRDEKTWRAVYLDGYWMYQYPVTVAQYKKFCVATKRKMPPPPPWGWKSDHPMVEVTWAEADAYAKWANASLPTEAQWEKAARGTQGQKYPWGHNWEPAFCVNRSNSHDRTASIYRMDRVHQSPFGMRDAAGNVWQWCRDWWEEGYYDYSPPKNPTGPGKGKERALRGGSWQDAGPLMEREPFRAADRGFAKPNERASFRGFRCVVNRP